MASKTLTDITVRRVATPATGQVEIADAIMPGFRLRVSHAGAKSFVLVYRFGAERRRLTIGRYPIIGLAEAREAARDVLTKIAQGVDPAENERRRQTDYTFEQVVETFLRMHCERHNKPITQRDTARILKTQFVSEWGRRDVRQISKHDVLSIVDRMVAENKPSAANHALAAIRTFFNWSVKRDIVSASPCHGIEKPGRIISRERVLDDGELAQISIAAGQVGYPFGNVVQLLLLTAQRRSEVAQMRWADADLEQHLWSLPAAHTKNNRQHRVPLSYGAVALIKSCPRIHDDLLFPAGSAGRTFSDFSGGKKRLDQICRVSDWTLHDLRRTAATGMARLGVAPHVVERILNHVSGTFGGVAGVYNRFQYLPEMRDALEKWAEHVAKITAQSVR